MFGRSLYWIIGIVLVVLSVLALWVAKVRRDAHQARQDHEAWFARVMAKNPGFEPKWRKVDPDKNGFIQWLNFSDRYRPSPGSYADPVLPEDLLELVHDEVPWSREKAARLLAEHSSLIEDLISLGKLTDRSSRGVSPVQYHSTGTAFTKYSIDLLMIKACIEVENGRAEHALEALESATGIAGHYSGIETPYLLGETVSLLSRQSVKHRALTELAPHLDRTQRERLHGILCPSPELAGPYWSQLIRGEAWVSTRGLAIPLLAEERPKLGADPDEFLDIFIQRSLSASSSILPATLDDIYHHRSIEAAFPVIPAGIGKGNHSLLEMTHIGLESWAKGAVRTAVLEAQYDAAFATLCGKAAPPEPLTGLRFSFDPSTRLLAAPVHPSLDDMEIKPLTIPE